MTLLISTEGAGNAKEAQRELERMLQAARAAFAARQMRKALDLLHAAHALATSHGLHRHAAQFKRALGILGNKGRPKLLSQPHATLDGPDPQ